MRRHCLSSRTSLNVAAQEIRLDLASGYAPSTSHSVCACRPILPRISARLQICSALAVHLNAAVPDIPPAAAAAAGTTDDTRLMGWDLLALTSLGSSLGAIFVERCERDELVEQA